MIRFQLGSEDIACDSGEALRSLIVDIFRAHIAMSRKIPLKQAPANLAELYASNCLLFMRISYEEEMVQSQLVDCLASVPPEMAIPDSDFHEL